MVLSSRSIGPAVLGSRVIFSSFLSRTKLLLECSSFTLSSGMRDFTDSVALEDDLVTDASLEGAGELVAIFEDDDVRGRGGWFFLCRGRLYRTGYREEASEAERATRSDCWNDFIDSDRPELMRLGS